MSNNLQRAIAAIRSGDTAAVAPALIDRASNACVQAWRETCYFVIRFQWTNE